MRISWYILEWKNTDRICLLEVPIICKATPFELHWYIICQRMLEVNMTISVRTLTLMFVLLSLWLIFLKCHFESFWHILTSWDLQRLIFDPLRHPRHGWPKWDVCPCPGSGHLPCKGGVFAPFPKKGCIKGLAFRKPCKLIWKVVRKRFNS